MKRYAISIVISGLLLGAANAQKPKDDKDKIQGTWACESGVVNGNPMTPEAVKNVKMTFNGDNLTLVLPNGAKHEFTYTLDANKNPKEFEMGEAGSKTRLKAIYLLEGDMLKYCAGPIGEERPKEFESKKDSIRTLFTLKKQKQ